MSQELEPAHREKARKKDKTTTNNAHGVEEYLKKPDSWEKIRQRVRTLCYRKGIEDAADDVYQNVCCKLLAAQSGFKGESKPTTWIERIIHNECINELRARRYGGLTRVESTDDDPDLVETIPDLNRLSLEIRVAMEQFRSKHPGLPSMILAILEKHGYLSTRDIAELVGRKKSAVNEAMTKKLQPAFAGLITFRRAPRKRRLPKG